MKYMPPKFKLIDSKLTRPIYNGSNPVTPHKTPPIKKTPPTPITTTPIFFNKSHIKSYVTLHN